MIFITIISFMVVVPFLIRVSVAKHQLSVWASVLFTLVLIFATGFSLAFIQDWSGSGYIRGSSFLGSMAIVSFLIFRKFRK